MEKVLKFYSTKQKDSLKYKAAVFLIENMPSHSFKRSIDKYNNAFDSIQKLPYSIIRKNIFKKILDSVSQLPKKNQIEKVSDMQTIDSNFLITNIELAFKAWHKIPKNKRASFDEFCNYILPYRNTNEPIETNSREKLFKQYFWVYDSLNEGTSIEIIIDTILTDFRFETLRQIRNYYPVPLSISQIEKSRLGLCNDGVNYFVQVFRSLGIICTQDQVSHWGNHHSSGHSWIYIKYGNDEYSTNISRYDNLKNRFKGESIPKVFRRTYSSEPESIYPLSINEKKLI